MTSSGHEINPAGAYQGYRYALDRTRNREGTLYGRRQGKEREGRLEKAGCRRQASKSARADGEGNEQTNGEASNCRE